VVGFLGPNGAGKSTTMKILTCFISPSEGDGEGGRVRRLRRPAGSVRSVLGYLPQRASLYPEMGVVEYLEFAADLRAIPKDQRRAKIKEVVDICGLKDALPKLIGELSYGYRQRVGLAQALIHDPPILILDEPTADLDPNESAEVIEYIKEIGKTRTVMLSTHDLAEVEGGVRAGAHRQPREDRGRRRPGRPRGPLGQRALRARVDEARGRRAQERGRGARRREARGVGRGGEGAAGRRPRARPSRCSPRATATIAGSSSSMAVEKGWDLVELRREALQLEEVFRELTVGGSGAPQRRQRQGREKE
jgi:ABC-2 type transport system ATP-binding protein